MDWRPMSEHKFPWEHHHVILMTFAYDQPSEIAIMRCRVGEHGAFFPVNTTFLTVLEQGWVPYAWCLDDSPARDDDKFPPLYIDYLKDRTPK
jgi:hypothetical protein